MTRILALETSGTTGSVAALLDGELLSELPLDPGQRSAQSLAPAIRTLLAEVTWQPQQIDLIALPIGPGSFTGLRVGVMTAKTLAYATGAAVVGLNTLELIAAQAPASTAQLEVIVDAQRQQLFTQSFSRDASSLLIPQSDIAIVSIDQWLSARDAKVALAGPLLHRLQSRIPASAHLLDEACWWPTASTVGVLAAYRFAAGECDDLWSLAPSYFRRSAAEEKREP